MEKHDFRMDLNAKIGGFEEQKQTFRIILVAKLEVSLDHDN